MVALRKESVDRKINEKEHTGKAILSLSARRAWIEKTFPGFGMEIDGGRSPQGERG